MRCAPPPPARAPLLVVRNEMVRNEMVVLLEVMVGEAIFEFIPDLAPLVGESVVSDGHLHLLAGRGVLMALLDRLELSIPHVQVHLRAEKER